jgi:hypothetical protein
MQFPAKKGIKGICFSTACGLKENAPTPKGAFTTKI